MEGLGLQLSYVGFCRLAHRVLPVKGYRLTEETRRDLRRAELDLRDEEFAAGLLLSLLLPLSVLLPLCLFFSFLWGASVLTLLLSGLLLFCLPSFLLFQLYPSMLAGEKTSRARGSAILTLLSLCFNLLHQPDLRKAMRQASKVGGRLSSDLKRSLLSLERGEFREAREALLHLSREWAELDETISEGLLEVLRSQTSPDEVSREASLERAVEKLIKEVEGEAEERLGKMVSPTVYFLSFGSLAIVLVVGLSPLFGMLGFGINLPFYLLSVGCLALIFWIFTSLSLRKRPLLLGESPTRLGSAGRALLFSTASFLPFLLLATRSPLWFVPAVGVSLSFFCFARVRSALKSREREERLRREWRRLISFLGQKMGEGRTFTEALREASTLFTEVGPELRESLALMQAKSLDPYSAFFEHGNQPRDPLLSGVLETSLELRRVSEAAAASALQRASEMLEGLDRVERRFRERMREAVSNLWMISIVLLPLVCSISVWVVGTFIKLTSLVPAEWSFLSLGLSTSELPFLSLFLGFLCLAISLSVARYIAGMTAPGDRATLLNCTGKTALLSTSVYLGSLLLFSGLV
jgi:hypothetical protein